MAPTSSTPSVGGERTNRLGLMKTAVLPLTLFLVFIGCYVSSKHSLFLAVVESSPIGQRASTERSWSNLRNMTDFHKALLPATNQKSNMKNQGDVPLPLSSDSSGECKPVKKIVYIKTHKTGSTTLVSIFQRFGYVRNLSFAVPRSGHIICDKKLFESSMLNSVLLNTQHTFDMLVNHARYNRKEMDSVVPGAVYVTIIRNPIAQLESAFGYFEIGKHLHIHSSNPLTTFMSNPHFYYARKPFMWAKIRNGQLFDLGFDHKNDENKSKIEGRIAELSREMDLVMISEYFDESLILLKKLMCWEYVDILYLSHGIRSKSHRNALSEQVKTQIRKWSMGDMMLYDHFNRTFWNKVENYGPTFKKDVAYFRDLEQRTFKECVDENNQDRTDRRVEKFVLKSDASDLCRNLLRGDDGYTSSIRKGMIERVRANLISTM